MTIQHNNEQDKPDEAEGGAAWEVRTAAEMLTEATGNPAVGTAMHRAIEGTVNATIAAMAPSYTTTFSRVLETTLRDALRDVKAQLTQNGNTTATMAEALSLLNRVVENGRRADLDWRTQWRTEDDARRDALHTELNLILSEMGGLKQQNTQLQEGFSSFAESVDELRLEVGAMRTEQQSMREDVATLKTNDMAKFEWLERLEAGLDKANDGAKHTNARIDQLVDVQLRFAERQRSLEENAAVGVMSGEQRASMMRWFMENIDKLQALIDAGAPQSKQANG